MIMIQIMGKQCERKYCHDVGRRVYISRTGHEGFMTIECDEHRTDTVEKAWLRFRRGVWW